MKPIRVFIVDDEMEARVLLKNLLHTISFVDLVGSAESVDVALQQIESLHPDVIMVDIHMPFRDGFELVKSLDRLNVESRIIFTTAYNSYAIKAIKHAVFDYLLKPINPDELYDSLIRFQAERKKQNNQEKLTRLLSKYDAIQKLRFETPAGFYFCDPNDLVYLKKEALDGKAILYESDGGFKSVHIERDALENLVETHDWFIVKKGIIINPRHIEEIETKKSILTIKFPQQELRLKATKTILKQIEKLI